jgi:hypothetical protein
VTGRAGGEGWQEVIAGVARGVRRNVVQQAVAGAANVAVVLAVAPGPLTRKSGSFLRGKRAYKYE